jgi:hypothetical protein
VNGRHAPISPRSRSLYNRNLKLPTAFFSPTHAPAKHVAKDWGVTTHRDISIYIPSPMNYE